TPYEMAEMMKSFGCVNAVNCDGGGTSTFHSKRAGTNELTMKSRPSDGAERATLNGIAVISNAVSDGVLSSVVVTAKKTSIAPGGKVTLKASGIDAAGGPAELPENLEFVVEDEEFGSIVDDKFISSGKFGEAVINAVIDGKIYGSITINVQAPDKIRFEDDAVEYAVKNATAGRRVELPVMGYIGNKPVEVSADDVTLSCDPQDGTIEGFEVIPNSTYAGGKEMIVTATLNADPSVKTTVKLQVYSISEIDFDYANAECSNYQERITETKTQTTTVSWCTKCNKEAGTTCKLFHRKYLENRTTEKTTTTVIQEGVEKSLAWNRDMEDAIENSTATSYTVTADPKKNDYTTEYTFGIDTTKIPLPSGVDSILNMVDAEGKYANAWEAMCSLAPRITTDTLITFKIPIDKKLQVDARELFIVSDWFEIASVAVDSSNTLNVGVRWKVQYTAMDPAAENPIIVCGGVKVSAPGLDRNQTYTFDSSGQLDYHICMLTSTGYKYAWMLSGMGGGAYEKSEGAQSGQDSSQGIYIDKSKVVTLKDQFTLNTAWKTDVWSDGYYYVNNKVFKNDIRYTVAKDGSNASYYYIFDENGNATLYNGRLEHDDKMCDVVDGVPVPVEIMYENGLYYVDGELATGVYRLPEVGVDNPTDELCYKIQDGKVASTYTGLYNDEGTYRYSYLGRYAAGWQMIKGDWYYFDETTLAAQTTDRKFHNKVTYSFETTGKLVTGQWYETDYGYQYYYGPDCYKDTFAEIDSKTYYFYDSYRYEKGMHCIRGAVGNPVICYIFGEDGVYIDEYKGSGLVDTAEGKFYLVDGVAQTGIYNIDGDFYYFNTSYGYAYAQCKYNVTILNGCDFTPGKYEFDENGKIISKNGYIEENGVTYYYVNSVRVKNALAQVGEDYYFFGQDGQPIKNTRYYVATSRCDLPAKQYYYFGADGKALQGIVDGKLYINGQLATTGIHKVGDDYYYSESGKVITDRRYYAKTSNCDLAAADYYNFGADGKALQGVVDGKLYVNGQPVKRGLTKIGEDYYYSESGTVITDRRYYATISNCDLPEKEYYYFGADGKALQGVVDGKLYINGQIAKRGLTEYKGDYYYSESGTVITDRRYYASVSNCDLPEKDYYYFGADGKALQGVVDGKLYINGQIAKRGLTEYKGDYYYSESGTVITDRRYYA
ncbi:MAG: phosphodiester glycosidase family protein, partial [Clostridia bacterium]|nr:phosphodiester glycosidase family protein [Clostridia bacterium]